MSVAKLLVSVVMRNKGCRNKTMFCRKVYCERLLTEKRADCCLLHRLKTRSVGKMRQDS